MADEPIDINKNKKALDKDMDTAAYLHTILHQAIDTHNQIKIRARDLERDADELINNINALMEGLAEKYPELFPEMEDEDENVET